MHGVKTHAQGAETHVIRHRAHAARFEVHGGGGGEGLGEGVGVSHHQHHSSHTGLKQTTIIRKRNSGKNEINFVKTTAGRKPADHLTE